MRPKLGEILVNAGVIDQVQIRAALAEQRKWGGRLGTILVQMRMLSEDELVNALSKQLNIPRFRFKEGVVSEDALELVDVDVCEKHSLLPVAVNSGKKILLIAMADPTNFEAVDEIQFSTGHRVQVAVCGPSEIHKAIRKYHYGETSNEGFGGVMSGRGAMSYTAFGDFSQENLVEEGISKPIVRIKSRSDMPKAGQGSSTAGPGHKEDYERVVAELGDKLKKVMQAQKELINLLIEKKLIDKRELIDRLKRL
ncbi:MAG: hypothetical protein GXP49_05280 [Deltaproteobacteria bacterium]|nr:hypothetical protein [Deltaproteobacteria bacterium]